MIVHHRVDGPGSGPAVVLSGSLGTTLAMWEPQAEALATRYRVVRYDHRGHGASPVPPGPYTIADLGSDVLALLDELELERVSFCGLSIGGMVGMWLGANAPDRIDRLVLACTLPWLPPPEQWRERAALVRARGIEAVVDGVLERWFTPAAPPELVEHFRSMLLGTPREGYAGCCEAIGALDLRPALGTIRAPTLVVTGAGDPTIPPEKGEELAAAIPGARHVTIPDARHVPSAERSGEFTAHLLAHLQGRVRA